MAARGEVKDKIVRAFADRARIVVVDIANNRGDLYKAFEEDFRHMFDRSPNSRETGVFTERINELHDREWRKASSTIFGEPEPIK